MDPYIIVETRAKDILTWLTTRGGLAVWGCLDLSDPGKTWTTPRFDAEGRPMPKPHWAATTAPERIITNPEEVLVSKDVEVGRCRIAVRLGASGLKLKLTDAASKRVRKQLEKAGEGSYYVFEGLEAIIMKPEKLTPILQWMEENKHVVQAANAAGSQENMGG